MIVYDRFWKTLKESNETTYTLITRHHISSATIDKLRKNKPMNTTSLNDLCRILDCRLEDIAEYTPSQEDQSL
jgi:DNA-binding Xre family transcriptional regulator